jgi:hypothetical protein
MVVRVPGMIIDAATHFELANDSVGTSFCGDLV